MNVEQTDEFRDWLSRLKDRLARASILARIDRLPSGNLGDFKLFDGILELRIHINAGYRIYCWKHGDAYILLMCGGNKSSQVRDIAKAKEIIQILKGEEK